MPYHTTVTITAQAKKLSFILPSFTRTFSPFFLLTVI
jgi:hypothetical protein